MAEIKNINKIKLDTQDITSFSINMTQEQRVKLFNIGYQAVENFYLQKKIKNPTNTKTTYEDINTTVEQEEEHSEEKIVEGNIQSEIEYFSKNNLSEEESNNTETDSDNVNNNAQFMEYF
jgi:S-adenosylmethionine synthetase